VLADAREEHARVADPDSFEFQSAEQHGHRAHERENANRLRDRLRFVEVE
jgi:hypothetical protein